MRTSPTFQTRAQKSTANTLVYLIVPKKRVAGLSFVSCLRTSTQRSLRQQTLKKEVTPKLPGVSFLHAQNSTGKYQAQPSLIRGARNLQRVYLLVPATNAPRQPRKSALIIEIARFYLMIAEYVYCLLFIVPAVPAVASPYSTANNLQRFVWH